MIPCEIRAVLSCCPRRQKDRNAEVDDSSLIRSLPTEQRDRIANTCASTSPTIQGSLLRKILRWTVILKVAFFALNFESNQPSRLHELSTPVAQLDDDTGSAEILVILLQEKEAEDPTCRNKPCLGISKKQSVSHEYHIDAMNVT